MMDEAIHLSEELGLADAEDDLPQWDEIILRLERCRPEWGWREKLNPYELSTGAPLAELTAPGIYNRAVLFAGTRSPFTYGLEIELRKLMQLDEVAVRNTALGFWLSGESGETPPPEDRPILEVVPHNTEQRQAVVQGLSAPLTVVTGPPGTGKSQVVTSLLANMAWQGESVLFSSKNNHAVDVVEARVNGLGPYPLLLRLGKEEHHVKVAQNLAAGLAESVSPDAVARYAWLHRAHEEDRARFAAVRSEIAAAVSLRNAVDELERAAEPARGLFDEERFAGLLAAEVAPMRRRCEALAAAIDAARESAAQADGPIAARTGTRAAASSASPMPPPKWRRTPPGWAWRLPRTRPAEHTLDDWDEFRAALAGRLDWADRVRAYGQGLERLRASRPLDRLARDLTRISEESRPQFPGIVAVLAAPVAWPLGPGAAQAAERVCVPAADDLERRPLRRRRRPARVPPLLQPVSEGGQGSSVLGGDLAFGARTPAFRSGLFDLAVIDEASQCDIASALPLLYRARRAVIIGDPLQLKHVSTVAPQEDRLLLAAHGLAEGRAAWAYSVNSLFDLARSLCRHEDIVNLRDHHRSHRDIIGFSNRHFYRGGLRIATDHEKPPPSERRRAGGALGQRARQGGAAQRRRGAQRGRSRGRGGGGAAAGGGARLRRRHRRGDALSRPRQPHPQPGAPGPRPLAAPGGDAVRGGHGPRLPGR